MIGAVEGGRGRIISIAVDPAYRGRGIGRALSGEVLGRLENAGVELIDLETRLDNRAAIRLWRALGFLATGLIPHYYGDQAALTMRRVANR